VLLRPRSPPARQRIVRSRRSSACWLFFFFYGGWWWIWDDRMMQSGRALPSNNSPTHRARSAVACPCCCAHAALLPASASCDPGGRVPAGCFFFFKGGVVVDNETAKSRPNPPACWKLQTVQLDRQNCPVVEVTGACRPHGRRTDGDWDPRELSTTQSAQNDDSIEAPEPPVTNPALATSDQRVQQRADPPSDSMLWFFFRMRRMRSYMACVVVCVWCKATESQ
jgi:hypothetical protein